ncbi:MAG: hypothetical protein JXR76_00830 [Deltaproteobacteria bacterium]|nr:hypothetical protein [Deltaproteobacteria bacterium]
MKARLLAIILVIVSVSPAIAADAPTATVDPAAKVIERASFSVPRAAPRISGTTESFMFLSQRQQMRQRNPGEFERQDLTVMPFYEILSLRADHLGHPGLSVHLQAIAGLDLADVYFDNRFIADPVYAYIQFQNRLLDAKLGRQMIFSGAAQGVHIDGARISFITPFHLGLDGYAGLLVSPKQGPDWYQSERASDFDKFGRGLTDWKREGDFAVGGRLFFRYEEAANIGVSLLQLSDNRETAARLLGTDLHIAPASWISILGNTNLDLTTFAMRDATGRLQFNIGDTANVGVEYKHVDPTLYIANTSIFSVFSNEKHNAVGTSVGLTLVKRLKIFAAYHQLFYQYLKDDDGEWKAAGETGQKIEVDTTLRVGPAAHYGVARAGFARTGRDGAAVNQVRVGGLIPFGSSGIKSSMNAYLDFYQEPVMDQNYSILTDVGVFYYTERMRTGATFRVGSTPWSDMELQGMITFAYNFLKTFSNQE